MRFSLLSLAALAVVAVATAAHADTIQTFNLNGTLTNGSVANGTVVGTVTINTTTGNFTGENVTFTTTDHGTFVFNQTNTPTGFYNGFVYATFSNATASSYLEINLPSLVGYQGGFLCSEAARCPGGNLSALFEPNSVTANYLSGTLTAAVASTPEPSSLILLGTGALGVVGSFRRRFLKA